MGRSKWLGTGSNRTRSSHRPLRRRLLARPPSNYRRTAARSAGPSQNHDRYAVMPRRQDLGASPGNIGRRSTGRRIRRGRSTEPGNFHRRYLGRRLTDLQRHRRPGDLPVNYLALGVTVAVIGMFIGRTAFTAAGGGEVNSEKAARKRYGVLLAFVVAG